jgi:hypothetical protein
MNILSTRKKYLSYRQSFKVTANNRFTASETRELLTVETRSSTDFRVLLVFTPKTSIIAEQSCGEPPFVFT